MRIWRARLLALLTAVAMLLAVSWSTAMADDGSDDWGDDDYDWYDYYYSDDDWYDD